MKRNDNIIESNDQFFIDRTGTKFWRREEMFHRDENLPAVEYADGHKAWYLNNICYRYDSWVTYNNSQCFWADLKITKVL